MLMKGVTLRGLEVFEALAATGSVAQAAERTGLSQPAVSQQMRNLETALGTELVDHGRRPMQLTSAGRSFLSRTQVVLGQLRLAQNELTVMDLTHLSVLNLGVIDDFDNDVTPQLVTILAENMTRCRFKLVTAPSHEIVEAMRARSLHIGISASPGGVMEGVIEYPLARDPFILVAPRDRMSELGGPEALMRALPFLRYDRDQMIGRQIEAHLARLKLDFPERFEIGAHLSLMTLVARGMGWAITTPLGYMRAARMHDRLEAHPLPFTPFARTIALFAAADWADRVPRDVARTMRMLVADQVMGPALRQLPWLDGKLRLIEPE
ncbi:MAG TPA: LysR family transcriptional regulator [Citreicella sp.]|jgi:DNA-binding transcriptional LysR family regulator|uniref:Transcriptional regulator, LysR family n=1 Tax=Salipiger marinus TaxID=555512 RepID=A0A1G8JSN0_9RHOB|nr:LysR family transcriptional regulator [Salipiger marinus]SDI34216.1 transcriptional regulator, LysR family [Salipiger marinus]HBM62175.1 LysR family transcriptional regulator [Citreicella sp.]|tara:strand:+ start:494 stop:1462 length:969 start_codon:yes stop_codon:yes gene_type:complete